MKWEYWLVIIVLLVQIALGGGIRLNTIIGQREDQLAEKEREISDLEEQVADLQQQLSPQPYYQPVDQVRISSGTGYRMDPMGGGTEGLHKGVDLVGPIGAPVKAALAGEVVEHWPAPDSYWHGHPTFGGLVVIDHGDGLFSLYGHLSETTVHEGWHVEAGQVIGALGDTGICTGAHLHFEIVVDPLRYLEER